MATSLPVCSPGDKVVLPLEAPMPSAGLQPSHVVLVVDDDRMMRALLVRILRAEGWRIYSAADAVEALAFLTASPGVDIVVSDVMMPRMDGREFAAELGKRFPRMPI